MSREVEYEDMLRCDNCGNRGAFDFYGDCLCDDCLDNESYLDSHYGQDYGPDSYDYFKNGYLDDKYYEY